MFVREFLPEFCRRKKFLRNGCLEFSLSKGIFRNIFVTPLFPVSNSVTRSLSFATIATNGSTTMEFMSFISVYTGISSVGINTTLIVTSQKTDFHPARGPPTSLDSLCKCVSVLCACREPPLTIRLRAYDLHPTKVELHYACFATCFINCRPCYSGKHHWTQSSPFLRPFHLMFR